MNINFTKEGGLVPAIVQDHSTMEVLMLGYMNQEAFSKTKEENRVTFYSRTKKRLWTKGETSGNYLDVVDISLDCDNDTLLIKATAKGPTCHTGNNSCFPNASSKGFIYQLEELISEKIDTNDENSYTNKLFLKGINKVAQKVGEEAVEVVIEAKDNNEELFKNEVADLLYHLLILLKTKAVNFEDIEGVLKNRNSIAKNSD